eukprot:6491119-Amphidinium_carterae.3
MLHLHDHWVERGCDDDYPLDTLPAMHLPETLVRDIASLESACHKRRNEIEQMVPKRVAKDCGASVQCFPLQIPWLREVTFGIATDSRKHNRVLLKGAGRGATPAHTSGKPLLVMFLVVFLVSILSHREKHVFAPNPSPWFKSLWLLSGMFWRVGGRLRTLIRPPAQESSEKFSEINSEKPSEKYSEKFREKKNASCRSLGMYLVGFEVTWKFSDSEHL